MKRLIVCAAAGLCCFFAGCSTQEAYSAAACDFAEASDAVPASGVPVLRSAAMPAAKNAAVLMTAPEGRQMAYVAVLTINTRDVAGAIARAQQIATGLKGYALRIENNSIQLKIPAAAMNASLNDFEKLGEVVSKSIRAEDVTMQVTDVKIRLENLQKLRQNLQTLFSRSAKVSELLEVERELGRVTTEIERYEAMEKNLALRVDYCDITIYFNPVADPAEVRRMISIPWVIGLGSEVWNDRFPMNDSTRKPFDFELPEGFVIVGSCAADGGRMLYAMNSDEVVLKFTSRPNYKGAGAGFWMKLIRRALQFRGFGLTGEPEKLTNENGVAFERIIADCSNGGTPWIYWVAAAVEEQSWLCNGDVVLIECWGPANAVKSVDWSKLSGTVEL